MLSEEELGVENRALAYAKKNRTSICRKLTDKEVYLAEENPVSVFMSGSPGAGKTEFSTDVVNKMFGFNQKVTKSSPLSDFVRNSSSSERKKIYGEAIKSAIESQKKVIEKSKQVA